MKFILTNPVAYGGRVPILTVDELIKQPPVEWLIDGLVPKGGLTGLCGAPGVGKSMLAFDWAMSVATGTPWIERSVQQGFVIYIAAEGHSGLGVRARAWMAHHAIPRVSNMGIVKGRLTIAKVSPNDDGMSPTEDYGTFFRRIDDEIERVPALVVIDTLARCQDGDENEKSDMTAFLDGAEQITDRYPGCAVVILHHLNATGLRERGHTSFRGAVGSLFFLRHVPKHEGILKLSNEKQRDAREAADIGLTMSEESDSAVIIGAQLPKKGERTHTEQAMTVKSMLDVLAAVAEPMTYSEWRIAARLDKDRFNKRLRRLMNDGLIERLENGRYQLPAANEDIVFDDV